MVYDVESREKGSDVEFTRVMVQIERIVPEEAYQTSKPNDYRLQNQSYCLRFQASGVFTEQQYIRQEAGDGREATLVPRGRTATPFALPFCQLPLLLNSRHCHLRGAGGGQGRRHRVRSDECPYDEGGYFIVNGSEKTLVAKEVNRSNRVVVLPGDPRRRELVSARVVSQLAGRSLYCKLAVALVRAPDGRLLLTAALPGFEEPLDLVLLMMLLYPGDQFSDRQILQYVSPEDDPDVLAVARRSYAFVAAQGCTSKPQARGIVAGRFRPALIGASVAADGDERAKLDNFLATRLLPHVGTGEQHHQDKLCFLGYMANLAVQCHLGKRGFDDRDHWGAKRLQLTGSLMHDLFRRCFHEFQKALARDLAARRVTSARAPPFADVVRRRAHDCITRCFVNSIATGNWRTGKLGQHAGNRTGVSQNLVRLSYAAAISQIRRATSDIDESSKAVGPRMLHSSQFGYMCPAETPEGGKVGLVKNFSLQCRVSIESRHSERTVLHEISNFQTDGQLALKRLNTKLGLVGVKIFVNGRWIGSVSAQAAIGLTTHLKRCRAENKINYQTSISYNEQARELVIATDSGRVLRPLFVVETVIDKDKSSPTYQLAESCTLHISKEHIAQAMQQPDGWGELLNNKERLIEYLDPYEEEQSLICTDLRQFTANQDLIQKVRQGDFRQLPMPFTHMEIHTCLVLSAVSALIPFPDHNQAPRNLFQASMSK